MSGWRGVQKSLGSVTALSMHPRNWTSTSRPFAMWSPNDDTFNLHAAQRDVAADGRPPSLRSGGRPQLNLRNVGQLTMIECVLCQLQSGEVPGRIICRDAQTFAFFPREQD